MGEGQTSTTVLLREVQENFDSLQNYVFKEKWRVVAVKDHVQDHEESKTEDQLYSRGDKRWGQLQRGSSAR